MKIVIKTGGQLAVYGQKDIFLSPEEARKLYHKLGELLGQLAVDGPKDIFLSLEEARELWEKLGLIFSRPVATPADTGRTVWATDGEGNPISPDELRRRGDAFAAGKS